jgi:HTH-type transcriptional regulator/antitoxin HigA
VTDKRPVEVFPPGEFIREELEARGWTQADLAAIMGRPVQAINGIVTGSRSVTPQTAQELGAALGTSAQLWLNLQASFDLHCQGSVSEEIAERARLFQIAPVKAMETRGWIRKTKTLKDLSSQLSRFYETAELDKIPTLKIAARSSAQATQEAVAAQVCWGYRARQIAKNLPTAPFSKEKVIAGLSQLRKLAAYPEEARKVPRVLASMGIRFVVVEHLPKSKIDGASLLVGGNPVIALSLRYDRIDNFWFTLMHELSHVIHGEPVIDVDIEGREECDPETAFNEARANVDAAEMLISRDKLDSFILRVGPLYSKDRINQFANTIHIHPGIIVGQLQHRGKIKFWATREMLAPIRHIVIQEALTDGWGRTIPAMTGDSSDDNSQN